MAKGNEVDIKADKAVVSILTQRKLTDNQVLNESGLDPNDWEIGQQKRWSVTMKKGEFLDGKKIDEKIVTAWNYHYTFKKKVDHGIDWDEVKVEIRKVIRKDLKIKTTRKKKKVGVVGTTDFHFGAYIDDLIRSDKFDIATIKKYLETAADIVNDLGFSEVHLAMLGDFVESFTGLNHRNSWKGLGKGMFGVKATILCFEILSDCFISKIKNVKGVYIVSGNHDRVTSENDLDPKGEVAELLAYMIKRQFPKLEVEHNALVINKVIDGISYIFTHGHHGMSKKDANTMINHWGQQGMFNVVMKGHFHERKVTKTIIKKAFEVKDVVVVELDESDSRVITCAPIFTGNFYSEALDFSSSAGFEIVQNNGSGRINHFNYCL